MGLVRWEVTMGEVTLDRGRPEPGRASPLGSVPITPGGSAGGTAQVKGHEPATATEHTLCLPPDRLLSLALLAFEGLNAAPAKDQCLACIEEAFFPPLWAPLLALYRYHAPGQGLKTPHLAPSQCQVGARLSLCLGHAGAAQLGLCGSSIAQPAPCPRCAVSQAWLGSAALCCALHQPPLPPCRSVYKAQEAALSWGMERHHNTPPADMGVPSKLLPWDSATQAPGSYPYSAAVQELRLIALESCPQRKLDCIGEAHGRLWGRSWSHQATAPPFHMAFRRGLRGAGEPCCAHAVSKARQCPLKSCNLPWPI